jgi:hypothetical protein
MAGALSQVASPSRAIIDGILSDTALISSTRSSLAHCWAVIGIMTRANAVAEVRERIRATMLQQPPTPRATICFRFVLGGHASQKLHEESTSYGDMVLLEADDSSLSIALKVAAWHAFAVRACPVAKFIGKTDDDTFVNTATLARLLRRVQDELAYVGKFQWVPRWLLDDPSRIAGQPCGGMYGLSIFPPRTKNLTCEPKPASALWRGACTPHRPWPPEDAPGHLFNASSGPPQRVRP